MFPQTGTSMVHRHYVERMRAVCGVLAVWLALAGTVWATPLIERISFSARADGQGYVVRVHASERLTAYSEPRFLGADRVEFILFNADLARNFHQDPPAGPVRAYHVESRKGHLFVELQLDPGHQVQAAAYRDRVSNDIFVGLTYSGGESSTIPVRSVATTAPPSVRSDPALDDARSRWKLDTIVIDAGHGGHDTGAIGAGGLREKDVTLAVALKVGRYLEEHLGVRVLYTRTDDRFITLRNRGKFANREGGKLFISIHANAARNRSAHGAETYFLGLHKTEAARSVMERENSVIKLENNPDVYDDLDEQALIVQTLAQSAYLRASEHLSELVQQQFTERVGRTDRGVKQAGFYVLWSASMPSILVELGFVTNSDEAAFLRSEAGQDYLASAIFRAVRDFKAQYEKGLDLVIQP